MSELLSAGLDLMLLGMGTVFIFLAVLVFFTTMMSRLLMRTGQPMVEKPPVPATPYMNNEQEIVAVAAAVAALVSAKKAAR